LEVYETKNTLTDEQADIARFWADDPMLSQTPPGHWMSIALHILERDNVELERAVDVLARLGIVLADAFIACWHAKFEVDLLRPVTYIRRVIDPAWETLIITPPFPEYPSGHSVQSGAAATVLTRLFGDNFAFVDNSHEVNGLTARSFTSFWHAADEAGMSRLYGGIHFRSAIENGLEQGRCIGAYTNALRTWS
jgi:membrane-associated phospholipid phosphatase